MIMNLMEFVKSGYVIGGIIQKRVDYVENGDIIQKGGTHLI